MSSGIRANYITNLSLSETSGGWSGFNAAMYASLARHFALQYVGPIAPPADLISKVSSKISRLSGHPGSFQFFSPRRLEKIAREVHAHADPAAALNFFHGSTPWIAFTAPAPYACYLDVCFATYISVYHDRAHFDDVDVSRIEALERAWLANAAGVFFSSRWALEEAQRMYELDDRHLRVAGMGGHIPIPENDGYRDGREFLFISLDFEAKGGSICVDAFRRVQREVPDVTLRIVGAEPPDDVMRTPGIAYEGRLNKAIGSELMRLRELFSNAIALVHPTSKDATPQVIIEAAYHGCPSIAPASFGIPELVIDGISGSLVPAPPNSSDVAERMLRMLKDPADYRRLRAGARAHSLTNFTWEQVGDRIAAELTPILAR